MSNIERVGLDSNYLSNDERIARDEAELQRLKEKKDTDESGERTSDENKVEEKEIPADTPEEKTWKARYGDLRRHEQRQKKDFEARISELEKKIGEAQTPSELPKSKKDLEEYKKKYPDVANLLMEMAREEAQKLFDNAQDKFQRYDEVTEELSRAQAVKKVKKEHPDFDEIVAGDEFHAWINDQPEWFSNVMFDQHEDVKSIIKVLDVFKRENGLTKEAKKEKDKENAQGISTRSRPDPDADALKGTLKESDIERMSMREYEEHYEEIQKARRSGKIIYDVSGGVR